MKADGLFIITAIIFIFVAWVATGGPSRPVSTAGPYITPVTRPGEESQGYRLLAPTNPIDVGSYPRQIGGAVPTITRGPDPYTRTISGSSAYSSSIYLERSTVGPASGNPNQEYVSIMNTGSQSVAISGWHLASKSTGASAYIGGGTETYRSGSVNVSSTITLKPGDKAIVLSGRSPVGASFRENICTGYLEQYQTFTPELSQQCPLLTSEIDASYTGSDSEECRASGTNLPRCAVVVSSHTSASCSAFAEHTLNYSGCAALHQNDTSFPLRTWRIFLDRNLEMYAKSHDTITLYDMSGKVVDSFSY
ncbi:MAG: lamin tail domain-containing protein [Bacillota bacterium]